MEIRRTGNTGFIDTGEGQLISFAMGKGWSPSSISFSRLRIFRSILQYETNS